MSSSDEEYDSANVPDGPTSQKLIEQFASVTGTDEAFAQFYLQRREWNLERSVDEYFQNEQPKTHEKPRTDERAGSSYSQLEQEYGGKVTTVPPSSFKMMSWNVDGLCGHSLQERTNAVCDVIRKEKPDIVFLQEVVPETATVFVSALPEYNVAEGGSEQYFTLTLLRRFTVHYESHRVFEYPGTRMGRNLLIVQAKSGPFQLTLMNTHLESTAEFSAERKTQLKACFEQVMSAPAGRTVIFGGDLNLRDKEVVMPSNIYDIWELCGSPKECAYTWDASRNTNIQIPSRHARLRFDRLYLRHSEPKAMQKSAFNLVGLQRLPNTRTFPSDHWGLLFHFNLRDSFKQLHSIYGEK